MIAKILIDIKTKELNRLFDYIIPNDLLDEAKVGMRVYVPFGEQNRLGFIMQIEEESSYDISKLKNITELLDIVPSITSESFLYTNYLLKTNNILLIEALETVLPNEIFLKYQQILKVKNSSLLPNELTLLFNKNGEAIYDNKLKNHKKAINKLIKEGSLVVNRKSVSVSNIKYIQTICYNENNNYKNKDKYLDLINFVKNNPFYQRSDLVEQGFNLSSINTLIKNDCFKVVKVRKCRESSFIDTEKIKRHQLNLEQENAYNLINENLNTSNIILINGITGSGKTEVYMQAIEEVLKMGKNVLYLVPEISLVPQTVNYFRSRFDEEITHFNSRLSKGERFDAFSKIIDNEVRILVGTRSSVFLPLDNLGLIIVDEEHDSSYNQEGRVQYESIELLKIKSKFHNVPVVLGSATPKVSSYYHALNQDYLLTNLTKRATNTSLPEITFVDMKEELKGGNTKIFSKILKEEITKTLKNNNQVILLYNRKGYSSFILCRDCGHTPKCPHCDISLTYFKEDNLLKCSYCNYKKEYIKSCCICNSEKTGPIGLGVDQVYDLVKHEFSDARVVKMDQNSTRLKGSYEKIWLDFREHKYDILVGTKMVSKGLDFNNVTLVGILMADTELKAPTFYAEEETYSLITQMSGRSGRSLLGKTIIQGYDLDNYAIKNVKNSYEKFYKEAIYLREIRKYEPFYQVVQILITNKSYLKCYQDALNIKKDLSKSFEITLGPSEPVVKFIKDEFRFSLTIKDKNIDYIKIFEVVKKYNQSRIKVLNTPQVL